MGNDTSSEVPPPPSAKEAEGRGRGNTFSGMWDFHYEGPRFKHIVKTWSVFKKAKKNRYLLIIMSNLGIQIAFLGILGFNRDFPPEGAEHRLLDSVKARDWDGTMMLMRSYIKADSDTRSKIFQVWKGGGLFLGFGVMGKSL